MRKNESPIVRMSVFVTTALLLSALPLLATPSYADPEWQMSGVGNCFQTTNSTYLNVTLCSSEVVNVTLESMPNFVSFTIETGQGAESTEITVGGFVPGATYYRHQDGHLIESFTADAEGKYSYLQDLTMPHNIWIAETTGTKYIRDDGAGGDCPFIGIWDGASKTCTLTANLNQMVVLDADGVTLNGNGYSVYPAGDPFAVYASGHTTLTVKNVVTAEPSGVAIPGIQLYYCGASSIIGNIIAVNDAITLYSCPGSTVSGNVINKTPNSGPYHGITLRYSGGSVVSNNQILWTDYWAIHLEYSGSSTVTENVVNGVLSGIELFSSGDSMVSGNTASGQNAIWIKNSGGTTLSGNKATSNAQAGTCPGYLCQGIVIQNSGGSMVVGNTVVARNCCGPSGGAWAVGMRMEYSPSSSITHNSVDSLSEWEGAGVDIRDSSSSSIGQNTVYSTHMSLKLFQSGDSSVTENVLTAPLRSVNVKASPNIVLSKNTISSPASSGGVGIMLEGGSQGGKLIGNTISLLGAHSSVGIDATSDSGGLTVDGNKLTLVQGDGVRLSSSDNVVTGNSVTSSVWGVAFTLSGSRNSFSRNVATIPSGNGLNLGSGSYNTITDNVITVSSGSGISHGPGGGGGIISNNKISVGYIGITLYADWGYKVSRNEIKNAAIGIYLAPWTSSHIIEYNVVSNHEIGIAMHAGDWGYSSYNIVRGNLISRNSYGITIGGRSFDYNRFYYNCIIDNTQQLRFNSWWATGNLWNDEGANPSQGTPMASPWGNFWSNYRGRDDGTGGRPQGDGVGDTALPHQGFDYHPLMSINMPNYGRICAGNTPPAIATFTASGAQEGQASVFTVVATDAENNPLTYSFDINSDGVYEQTGSANTFSFVWGDDHSGNAKVRVSDGELYTDATATVTVTNVAPQVTVSDGPAVEGSPLEVSYHVTDSGSDDVFVKLEWGDGVTNEESYLLGPTPDPPESTDLNPRDISGSFARTFGDNVVLTGTLTVWDDDGGIDVRTIVLEVVNGEPKIVVPPVLSGYEGSPVGYSSTATDPGSDDLTFCWVWDDGSDECHEHLNGEHTYPFTATDSGNHVWGDDGNYDTSLTVTDDDGGSTEWAQLTAILNVAPTPSLQIDALSYFEGSPTGAFAQFMDPGTDDVTLSWVWAGGPTREITFYNDGSTPDPLKSPGGIRPFSGTDSMVHTYEDNGLYLITLEACDDDGGCATVTQTALVENLPPVAHITGPAPGSLYALGETVTFEGMFTDPGIEDTHIAFWQIDSLTIDGTVTESGGQGLVTGTHVFDAAGVYMLTLIVADKDGGMDMADTVGELTAFVVVYDPMGGFVTGGGWINSPPGAYAQDFPLTGKATFGFVAKYNRGANVPQGQTEFQFKVADFNFHSTSYEWLVCTKFKCQFKGHGTVNGAGDYGFLLSAIDGQLPGGGGQDKLRMKIWNIATGQVIYDNQLGYDDFADPTTVIGGGSIVIHKG